MCFYDLKSGMNVLRITSNFGLTLYFLQRSTHFKFSIKFSDFLAINSPPPSPIIQANPF